MRKPLNEVRFIQVYRELTSASEAQARSVFILACCADDAESDGAAAETVAYRAEPKWEEEFSHEPASESRSLPYVHQLSGATRERFV